MSVRLPGSLLLALVALGAASPAAAAPPSAPPGKAAPALTKPPALLQFVEAPFPMSEAGKTGSVVLAVTIRDDGTVEDATVTESAGEAFDAAAIAAVRQFVFSPAEVDGKPSRIKILYRYDFVERAAVPTTALFSGIVKDRFAHVPLADVTVTLADGRSTRTDPEGHFAFADVPPGPLVVTLEGERLTALSTEETFVAGEHLDTVYEVELAEPGEDGDDMEILVVAPTIKKQAVSTEIPADQARRVPGTDGDVLRVVENLPGVARASMGTGALVVWGAAPEDTGVYVDGVPVPRLYHDGGLRSVVGPDFIRSVELVPGGYGAAYGRGLGGLVSATTNRFDDGQHGAITADVYDASASVHGPVGPDWNFGVAGRYGYVGPLLATFYPGVEEFFPVPHYSDGQARAGLRIGPGETLELTGLLSSDSTASTAPSPDPARQAAEQKDLRFQRVYLRYSRDIGDGTTVAATVFVGADHAAEVDTFGQVETDIATDVTLGGVRASYRTRTNTWLTLEGGLDALLTRAEVTREGSVAVPAREGDQRVFGQPPPDQISSDQFTIATVNAAPYVEADVALLGDTLHLVPGLRADPYVRSVSRATPQIGVSPTYGLFAQDLRVEPRVQVRFAPDDRVSFTAAYGRYGAQPQASQLSASFGTPTLPATEGTHFVLGGACKPVGALSVEATGYYTRSEGLAMRSDAAQTALAEALEPSGSGRTYGVQALVRLDPTAGFFGWVSYTLGWSERRDTAEADWRPSDYDQRHVLTGLAGYQLPLGFEAGLRARVATGYPRSSVTGATYDNRRDLYEPLFGGENDIRLPTFFQLDARVAKRFAIGASELELSFEVQNATNQANVEEYIYNADYSERGAIDGVPLLPVLGLRWSI
jgi:TonB family protein